MSNEELHPEVQKLHDGLEATVKLCKWTYDLSREYGFTEEQSMKMAITYMQSVMTAAQTMASKE